MSSPSTSRPRTRPTEQAGARSRPARRDRRAPARWEGLDAARGLAVLGAVVFGTGAALAPAALGPTVWLGIGVWDLVPPVLLVVAGAGLGWRHEAGGSWPAPRRRRRVVVLVGLGLGIAVVRAGGDPAAVGADELLRLVAATSLAAVLLRLRRPVTVAVAAVSALAPAALVAGDPLGRGLRVADPASAWWLESTLGLPTGGVPVVSLPAAVTLVLSGAAFGVWAQRRPPGPATAAALGTVGVWCLIATVITGQVIPPAPLLLDLPVAAAGVGLASLLLAVGHLVTVRGGGAALVAVGRTALPIVVVGTVALATFPTGAFPELPTVAALTAGGVLAWGAVAAARRLDASRWTWRA